MTELSIIVPVYKGKEFIKETIESIKKIECSKEIIIIDDGSPDDSYEYCKKIFEKDKEIVILHKKNGGIVDARNFGLARAKGKFVMFCDQDDICFAETVRKAVQSGIRKEFDVIFWSTVYLLENDQLSERDTVYYEKEFNRDMIKEQIIEDMILNIHNKCISYIGHVWSAIYRRDVLEKNSIKFKKFVDIEDDYLFLLDVLSVSEKVLTIKNVGYAWRYNRKSETYRIKHIDNIIEKYNNLYGYIGQKIQLLEVGQNLTEKFDVFSKQETIIRSLENSYTFLVKSKEEKIQVKEFYKKNRKYFKQENIVDYVKKRKRIYKLLKYNLFSVAGLYVYLDSIRRKIKAKL